MFKGSVMFNFLTGMKTRLCGMEIQCVRWIALLFNNMPDVQLAKHPSCEKQQQKWTKTPINSFENYMIYTVHAILHLSDNFIQSDLRCIQAIHIFCQYMCSLGIEPTTFVLLTQCSTTEPQEQTFIVKTFSLSLKVSLSST